jgi:hypothetical protein
MALIEIHNGDHQPPHAFMIVERHGLQVDLANVQGELWDANVASVIWGHVYHATPADPGKVCGIVRLKNGQTRRFFDFKLMAPYLAAYAVRKAEEDAKHQANVKAAADAAIAEAALSAKRDNLAALTRRLTASKPAALEAPIGA